ncbi:hypothetical protein BDC45DRAFT_446592, partial [Circinella umbellata]
IVCEIDQLSWGASVAFGEAKLSKPTNNINSLGQDLMRLAILGEDCRIECKNDKLKSSVSDFSIASISSVSLSILIQFS